MKAYKKIVKWEDVDIEIKDITLLSTEAYEACKDIVPNIAQWWLRSPGNNCITAASVDCDGNIYYIGRSVYGGDRAVRPALIFKSSNFQIGDKIKVVGYDWTVISDNMMLCDDVIGHTYFRKDWRAEDANVYEKSDIKKWLEKWLKEMEKE